MDYYWFTHLSFESSSNQFSSVQFSFVQLNSTSLDLNPWYNMTTILKHVSMKNTYFKAHSFDGNGMRIGEMLEYTYICELK